MRTNIPNSLKELIEHSFVTKSIQHSLNLKKELFGEDVIELNLSPKRFLNIK